MSAVRMITAVAAIATLTLTTAPAAAQQRVSGEQTLPAAAQIIARYHDVVGISTFTGMQSLHSVGELTIPAAGITGTLEVWQGRPNRTLMLASVPQYGEIRTGFTGEVGWSLDPVEGPRILSGPEAVQAADDAHFESHLRTAELVDSAVTVERTTLSGYDCYKVQTFWKTGRETHDCYSAQTGLLVGSLRTHHSSAGPAGAIILYEEYREFGGLRMPTRITTQVSGIDQVIILHTVTLNEVPDAAFEPPAEIRALLGG